MLFVKVMLRKLDNRNVKEIKKSVQNNNMIPSKVLKSIAASCSDNVNL